GLLQHAVYLGVVGRQVGEVDVDPLAGADRRHRLREGVEHPQPQEVDLDDAQVGAVVLVPLHDEAAGHRGGLQGDHLVQPAGGDHHAARVLAQVAGEVVDAGPRLREVAEQRLGGIEAGGGELGGERPGGAAGGGGGEGG